MFDRIRILLSDVMSWLAEWADETASRLYPCVDERVVDMITPDVIAREAVKILDAALSERKLVMPDHKPE